MHLGSCLRVKWLPDSLQVTQEGQRLPLALGQRLQVGLGAHPRKEPLAKVYRPSSSVGLAILEGMPQLPTGCRVAANSLVDMALLLLQVADPLGIEQHPAEVSPQRADGGIVEIQQKQPALPLAEVGQAEVAMHQPLGQGLQDLELLLPEGANLMVACQILLHPRLCR